MSWGASHLPKPPTIEDELALRLCGTAERREADREVIEVLWHRADPEHLLTVLRRLRVVALLGPRLEETLPCEVPEAFRATVAEHVTRNRHRSALFAHMTNRLCEVLGGAGVESVALKGAGLAERVHGDLGLRRFQTDIDLLVDPAKLQDAVSIVVAEGGRVSDNVDWGNDLPHYHSRLIIDQPVEVRVELHWRLHWYERRFAQEMLARSTLNCNGSRNLQPIDEIASLLLIFARDGYLGLRIPADIAAWWDIYGERLPDTPLNQIIDSYPQLRNPLLAAVDVLQREVGLPARRLVDPMLARPRQVRFGCRLVSWTARDGDRDYAINVTFNDLLLTPRGAYRVFLRHYYLQPLDHYLSVYGWPAGQRIRIRARRFFHAAGRIARSAWQYARRAWQLRSGRAWEPLPGRPEPKTLHLTELRDPPRVLIVSPVRNEAAHIERVVRSVAAQTRPPDLWIIADDGSDDETTRILHSLKGEVPFLRVVELPPVAVSGSDRLAQALEVRAFNRAISEVDIRDFTHIGKLDGDIELPRDYFERLLTQMERNPLLGIAGGAIIEPRTQDGAWRKVTAPEYHVHGALKFFTRECFEVVGGLQERLGWDTIDETYARMRGFETRRDRRLVARHHRPTGSAAGMLRGRMREGQCAYIARYSLPWVFLRSTKVAIKSQPFGIAGPAFVFGYLAAALRRADRVEDEGFKRFVRAEHQLRIRHALRINRGRCTTSA